MSQVVVCWRSLVFIPPFFCFLSLSICLCPSLSVSLCRISTKQLQSTCMRNTHTHTNTSVSLCSPRDKVAEVMRLKVRRRDGTIGRFKKDHRSSFSGGTSGDLFRSGESQKVRHGTRTRRKKTRHCTKHVGGWGVFCVLLSFFSWSEETPEVFF